MKRIQRKRKKGWRMPPNAKYVGRGSKWGNPFKVVKMYSMMGSFWAIEDTRAKPKEGIYKIEGYNSKREAQKVAVDLFRVWSEYMDVSELVGKDLACWCGLDEICHADVLIAKVLILQGKSTLG